MTPMKVMTIVGTRPEVIKLCRVIRTLDAHVRHVLVHTGQNHDYELNQVFFEQLEIRKPDHFLNVVAANLGETLGNILARGYDVMALERPDALLLLGDTNSCLAAIVAKRLKIPIFHMEAGNRCFDQRVPEELNRKIVDHVSDINLTYSDHARDYLLREGLPPDRVIKTGSPMYEVLAHYRSEIQKSSVLKTLQLKPGEYFVVSAHREENVDSESHFRRLLDLLTGVAETYGQRIVFSVHPRTKARIDNARISLPALVELHKPFGFFDYVNLQRQAHAVISDSGTITEESSILNFPAVNIREAHERPEGMEEGAVMMTGLDRNRVLHALAILEKQPRGEQRALRMVRDYDVPNVSEKVLRIILSYTDYVNRLVWHK
ncbi:MAG TPA: UDP-N-acetylglucosamine 2-epimerase (non-hydrolyzing) [Nitrospiraceae bacterium]|nr:UDP-N-acetylglucosamine 2-epimerase (non-hydrolyzing) [Nitrospiraceae bacterium]